MKKMLILLFFSIMVSFACNTSYIRMELPVEMWVDWPECEGDSAVCAQCSAYMHHWYDLDADALPSVMDSNIYIFWPWENGVYEFFAFSQNEHTILEIIKDEFIHYQQCGLISYSREKLDSMFVQMDETLGALEEDFYIWYEYPCRYSYTAKDELVGTHFAQSYCSDTLAFCPCYYGAPVGHTDIPRVIDSVYKARCGIDGINTVKLIDEGNKVVVSNDIIQIPYQYKDRTYSLTDLQGRILEQGFLGSQLPRSKRPIILKINGLKATYIK